MYLSISFDDKNTWDDWRLVPSSQPVVAPPEVKEHFVELPLGHGSVDLTEFFGTPRYGMRTGSWEFLVADEHIHWETLYSMILAALHGQHISRIILETDPGFYYSGRVKVNAAKSSKTNYSITLDYTLYPYKTSTTTGEEVL